MVSSAVADLSESSLAEYLLCQTRIHLDDAVGQHFQTLTVMHTDPVASLI
jgi:hypothetical protein